MCYPYTIKVWSRPAVESRSPVQFEDCLIMKTHLQTVLWGLMIFSLIFAFHHSIVPQAVAQDGEEDQTTDDADQAHAKGKQKDKGAAAAAEPETKNFLTGFIEV